MDNLIRFSEEKQRAMITGTNSSVRAIAAMYKQGLTATEIQERKSHLTLEQTEAAIAYYRQHRAEVAKDIQKEEELYQQLSKATNR